MWMCLLNIGTILWPIILHNAVAVYTQNTSLPFLYFYHVSLAANRLLPSIQIDSIFAIVLQVLERDGKV